MIKIDMIVTTTGGYRGEMTYDHLCEGFVATSKIKEVELHEIEK
jgi:hypothetical protein